MLSEKLLYGCWPNHLLRRKKSFVLLNEKVPVWKDKDTAGVMTFAKKEFTADAEPVPERNCESLRADKVLSGNKNGRR